MLQNNQPPSCAAALTPNKPSRGVAWGLLLLCICGLPLAGCLGTASGEVVYGYPVAEVETTPVEIETYPRYVYRGEPAYLVDGRWYYRSRGRWVVFRREPQELMSVRVHYETHGNVRRVPPERRWRDRR